MRLSLMPVFQSTSPVRGTTDRHSDFSKSFTISIHVPREGDDLGHWALSDNYQTISIHVPREGDDSHVTQILMRIDISIHVPREGDDFVNYQRFFQGPISIHVPREGDDPLIYIVLTDTDDFNPRPP